MRLFLLPNPDCFAFIPDFILFSFPCTFRSLPAGPFFSICDFSGSLQGENPFLSLYSSVTTLSFSSCLHQVLKEMALIYFPTFHPLSTHWVGLCKSLLKLLARCYSCQIQLHFINLSFLKLSTSLNFFLLPHFLGSPRTFCFVLSQFLF